MTDFDLSTWKTRVAAWWRDAAKDLDGTMRGLGVSTAYGLLSASAFLPLLAAYADQPGAAVTALVGIVSGVGSNLAANLVQGAYDMSSAPRKVEQEVAEQPALRAEYQQMLAALDVVSAAQAALGDRWNDFSARLAEELAKVGGELVIDTGGGAAIAGGVTIADGDFVGRDQIVLNVAQSARAILRHLRPRVSPETLQQATEHYLQYLWDRHCYLSLKGMGVSDRVPLRLPLLELYVPLRARRELPKGETWQRDAQLAGRQLGQEEQEALTGRLGEPQPVLDLLQENDGLIVLGDPGAGKTTFLMYLTLQLALGEGETLSLGERLPILLAISAYANALAEGNVRLDDFIAVHLNDIGADLPIAQMVEEALAGGRALILLDGLDEVRDTDLRHTVIERVTDFYALHRRAGNKFVITSRIVGYQEVRPTTEGLAECTLVDFDREEIAAFVGHWTGALERQALGESAVAQADAERERQELLDTIERNSGVRQLAANPLLLTILALMKRQGVVLPERRVELYEQYVRTLLSSWNRARGLDRPPARDLDVVQTVRILAPLALWMHETNPGAGLVKREDMRRRLEAIYVERGEENPEAATRQFLADVREHASILLERGPGEYGFIHLTFEEYLAAVAIALQGQGDCRPVVDALSRHIGSPAWREVGLLTVAYLGIIQQLDQVAGDVVEALVAEKPGDPGEAALLAGQAVLDAGTSGVPQQSRQRVIEALAEAMVDAGATADTRREAGLLLGNLGWRPADLDAFVQVPAGTFLYGDEKEERTIPYRYLIGKYPVTNAQYARFVEDGGYHRQDLWSEAGWRWCEQEKRKQPGDWDNTRFNNPIFPVVSVTQYEAEAYCNWLTANLRLADLEVQVWDGGKLGKWLPSLLDEAKSLRVRLPTEEEWESAARGAHGREYPWGDEFEPHRANTWENGTMSTTAVSTYLHGVSPVGAWDMSGNVFEWTMPEPVLRGGCWFFDQWDARCASRLRDIPDLYYYYLGFRVVVSLAFEDSEF